MAEHELESSVEKMEAMFSKADSNIEYLSRKLNDDFCQGMGEDSSELSPLEMKRRLQQVKKEFNSLQDDAESIKKAQEEMMSQFKNQIVAASQAIQRLQITTGLDCEDSKDQQAAIESLLGVKLPSTPAISSPSPQTEGSPSEHQSPEQDNDSPRTEESSPSGSNEEDIPIHELRASSLEFVPVHESEFKSVSEFVRGRSVLGDVNKAYRKLYDHFQEEPDSAALTVKEMTGMGMRITGATGQAKLKVLRALKIITISNKGDVKIV
ncbi:SKA complex subunit 2-like [Apostichopus japonicus]|uniref:SKA complex subunit 2-like n=1 Tax=Stichopus japonicus TaxID=307972 RepID=UPI003AB598BE